MPQQLEENQTHKPRTLVMKFGGTSVGTSEAMAQTAEIVGDSRSQFERVVVITSALSKVTNLLLDSANKAMVGDIQMCLQNMQQLREIHYAIADKLVLDIARCAQLKQEIDYLIDRFFSLCQAVSLLGEATPRALDSIAALGERMSVRLLSAVLEQTGVAAQPIEATQLIVTDDHFQNAHPDFNATEQKTRQCLEPILAGGRVPVVTGFIAANADGITTTLGRGGSDYTAGILGAVLMADEVWIWTDVDGVMTADPRMVPAARTLDKISYREISELAYFGAKVLHPKTIRPVLDAGISLRICNTFNPGNPGTRLVPDDPASNGSRKNGKEVIRAVTAIRKQRLVTVEGRGMLGVPGVAARTFTAVASTGTSVPLITQASSEQSICFVVPSDRAEQIVSSLEQTFEREIAIKDIDRIWANGDVSIITAVGAGMIHTPGVAGQIFTALGRKKVNVKAIAQGSSEVSISLVVTDQDTEDAVKALHALILNENHTSTHRSEQDE